jgi:adenylate cyclase
MDDTETRHRLLAILAADAVGYSRLMSIDESNTVAALDAAREVFRSETISRQGRVVDTAGDSVLAVFGTAIGAGDAALAIQRRLAEMNAGIATESRLRFRIGLHLGDVIEKPDGTIYGNGVNVAARLQARAEPGEAWVSDAIRSAISGSPGRRFDDQGRHRAKNIAEPVHAYRMTAGEAVRSLDRVRSRMRRAAWWIGAGSVSLGLLALLAWLVPGQFGQAFPPTAKALRPLSLALGSVVTTAGNHDEEAAKRLRRELSAALSGPTYRNFISVLALPDIVAPSAKSQIERARTIGARFVLHGELDRQEDRDVALLQVVAVESGAQLWSSKWASTGPQAADDKALGTRELVRQIASTVFSAETLRVLSSSISELTPNELALRSDAVYEAKPTLQGIDEALVLVDRALAFDANSVWALLTKANLLLQRYDEEPSPDHERYARELESLTAHAVALDPRSPFVWSMRAYAVMHDGRWTSAIEAIDKMMQIDPDLAICTETKAEVWVVLGRPAEALKLLETNPLRHTDTHFVACHAQALLGHFREAIEMCEKSVGTSPMLWSAHLYLAAAHASLGETERAHASLKVVNRMSPGHTIARLRAYRNRSHPEYQRLAEAHYYPGLKKAGMAER